MQWQAMSLPVGSFLLSAYKPLGSSLEVVNSQRTGRLLDREMNRALEDKFSQGFILYYGSIAHYFIR